MFAGCAGVGPLKSTDVGTGAGVLTGAGVGALIGQHFGGRGGMIVGALVGGAIGGMIGYEIGKSLSEPDRRIVHQRYGLGLSEGKTGTTYSWANPVTGASTKYTPKDSTTVQMKHRIIRPTQVQAPGAIDVIGEPYVAGTSKIAVRTAPMSAAAPTGEIKPGEQVIVIGKLQHNDWYVVGRDSNVTLGYVPVSALRPAGAAPSTTLVTNATHPTQLANGYVTDDVAVTTVCRGLDYEIAIKGETKERSSVSSCKAPDGNWHVQRSA